MQPVIPRTTSGRALPCPSMLGAREHPLLGLLAHRAGVDAGSTSAVAGSSRARVAAAIEQAQHQLAVGDVHLAAVGLEVDLPRRRAVDAGARVAVLRNSPATDGGWIEIAHGGGITRPCTALHAW